MTQADEHTRAGLLRKLADLKPCPAGPEQLATVDELLGYFERHRLLRHGRALPLHDACPSATECWAPFGPHERPDPGEGEVSVPWVGRDFFRHRIVVVAINFNRYSPLGAQWWIRRGDIHDRLGHGSRRLFPYRVGQYLAAIVASQSGRRVIVDPDPSSGAQGLEACAFIQAVQCSPARRVSQPGDAMWANCPQRYLVGQMQILKPRVVLAVGQVNVWPRVTELLDVSVDEERAGFRRGRGQLDDHPIDVLFANHPSYGNWCHSLPVLVTSLNERRAVLT